MKTRPQKFIQEQIRYYLMQYKISMRINLITHELSFSGGIMQLSIIANKLKELGYEVKIISVGHKDENINIKKSFIFREK